MTASATMRKSNPTVGGVEFTLGNDGVVVWSSDWDQLYRWAEKKQRGFHYRSGGPDTFGHTDVVFQNPAKFDRCVRDVKKRGGAANAYAVCTAAGTRNPATARGFYVFQFQDGTFRIAPYTSTKEYVPSAIDHAYDTRREAEAALKDYFRGNPEKPLPITDPRHPQHGEWAAKMRHARREAALRKEKQSGNPAPYGIGDERGVPIGSPFQSREEAEREARSLASSGERVELVWKKKDGSYGSKWFGPKKGNPGDKAFIARFTDGYTTRIDATSKAEAVAQAKAMQRESGARLKKLIPMTPDWSSRIRNPIYTDSEYWGAGHDHAGDFLNRQGKPIIPDSGTTLHLFLQLYPEFYSDSGTPHTKRQFTQALSSFRRGLKAGVKAARRKNPSAQSAEVFEDFHGHAPTEVVTVSKRVHHHAHLASLGTLVSLDVWGVDQKGHKITGFKKALLCSNEDRNQLFIEGGDQRVNLGDFGIRQEHELETLGRVTEIAYHTNKTHLGKEGGEAVYVHRFRSTNENGKHVMVKMTREPELIYDVRNEQLLFSGGSYEILREGIDR